jgi:hypothetical protein
MNKPYGKKFKGPGNGFKKFKGGPNRPKNNSFKVYCLPEIHKAQPSQTIQQTKAQICS